MSTPLEALPRVTLKPRRALPFFSRHPWVFAGAVARAEGNPAIGAEVGVFSHEQQFIARGLFNPDSNIRVRLYSWEPETALDAAFWSARLDEAFALRAALTAERAARPASRAGDGSCRLVSSEGDGLSGLTVDRYADWLLVQITSRAMYERRELFIDLLTAGLTPPGIWLRTEKGIREAEGLDQTDGLVAGEEPPRPLFIQENGVRFGVDVVTGQKTGFYFDQRTNRAAVARYCRGQRVLDLFCYTGGFGVTAAAIGGAGEVLGIDTSASALNMAVENARLNDVGDRVHFEKSDVHRKLAALYEAGEQFGVVVTDPPKFARHRKGIDAALKAYVRLNAAAVNVTRSGGLLAACSCSGLVSREQFHSVLSHVGLETGRRLQILEDRGQAGDHPVSVHCPESAYLKCVICRVL